VSGGSARAVPGGLASVSVEKDHGPLFGENTRTNTRAASKKLNRFLDDIGITDPSKVAHSLRHRAKDRARAARCPWAVQGELFGRHQNNGRARLRTWESRAASERVDFGF
jgi:hypothetical protein